ncbi:HdeD family acid-resistance protein, partial [Mesorhizobium sp. M5C.F.Ca.IN.020.32.2.1]
RAGLVIAMGWPVNSVWVLGLFLAVDLIFQGWAFIAVGLALKK